MFQDIHGRLSRRGARSTTAAFTIVSLGYSWSARLNCTTSCTTSVLVGISGALKYLTSIPADHSVILCNSRCALQRLARVTLSRTRLMLRLLSNVQPTVALHLIPSDTGIPANAEADKPTEEIHSHHTRLDVLQDPQQLNTELHQFLSTERLETNGKRTPLFLHGLSRSEVTSQMRMRTGSVHAAT